jgi:hypothetical protein
MYLWLWRHLPGGVMTKLACTIIVFPWLTPQLPLDRVMPR